MTAADLAAQAAVVGALAKAWPGLTIVGEEDEAALDEDHELDKPLDDALLDWECTTSVDLSKARVFVGPARRDSGVRRGAPRRRAVPRRRRRGRRARVWCRRTAVSRGRRAAARDLRYGSRLRGTHDAPRAQKRAADAPLLVIAGDGSDAAQAAAVEAFPGADFAVRGAAGNKLKSVAEGEADIAILHRKTSAWDTCAPSAAILAAGGRVTDYFGAPLSYTGAVGNTLGVIASSARAAKAHDAACATLRRDARALAVLESYGIRGPSHAADIARDGRRKRGAARRRNGRGSGGRGRDLVPRARGRGLPRRALRRLPIEDSGHVGLPETREDAGASCSSEKSNCGAAAEAAETRRGLLPRRGGVLVIRRGERDLWRRRASRCRRCCPRRSTRRPTIPLDAASLLFLRDFSPDDGYRQSNLLEGADLRATLKALARFHAHFSEAARRPRPEETWRCGGHWQPAYQNAEQFESGVEDAWPRLLDNFRTFSTRRRRRGTLILRRSGRGSSARPWRPGREAHPFAHDDVSADVEEWRTLIHGDLKAANVLVKGGEQWLCWTSSMWATASRRRTWPIS